ncbi:MAG TPA: glycosyltransferase [Rhodothermia bacterium]|nr:glycosyltransferase [Rhodothermia bacterium]
MHDPRQPRLRPLPDTPRVTVITMCKDRAWCIDECVRSVLRQDYPNIEYLVQDGASRDDTLDVLEKYEDRLQICSEPDRGPMDAFHKALARATGDLFCILLSDERFSDDKVVSRVVEAFHRYPDSGAIYGDFRIVDVNYREIGVERKQQISFEELFCYERFISPCAACVRFDTLRENGILKSDLRSFFDIIGDFGLWVYVGSRYPLKYVPGIMADFMVHGGEISYGLKHCQAYIRECETAIESFHSDAYAPHDLAALKNRALARLYLNYSNVLAGKYFSEPVQLTWKGIRRRPRLIFTKTFLAVLIKSAGLSALLPARGDGRRMKQSRP